MQSLITPAAMRDMERQYFDETGTPSFQLMGKAAQALSAVIKKRFEMSWRYQSIAIACGPGGNGGDGYACAAMLSNYREVSVISAEKPVSPDATRYMNALNHTVKRHLPNYIPDIWVDALYGTGLSRAPSGEAAKLIERMNADREKGSKIVAVDIPSGLNGMTGTAYEPCVKADLTVTFQYAKPGCFLADGLDMSGEVLAADIGIPLPYYPDGSPALVDDTEVRAMLLPRPRNFHKGNAGHLLIVAGSFGMAGAAAMCARAALTSGAGLVTIACPRSIVPMLQTLVPCAMCVPLPEADGAVAADAVGVLESILPGKTALVCGCGLSRRASAKVVEALLDCGIPALLDADALNLISESDDLKARLRERHLITPHPGEAARLLGRRVTDPIHDALALKALGCQALLKGASTVIPVGNRPLISHRGTSGMAKGGSGDCLAGIIGALMAQQGKELTGDRLALCAAAGCRLHGIAGEIARERRGIRGMTPLDLIDALPEVLKRYE